MPASPASATSATGGDVEQVAFTLRVGGQDPAPRRAAEPGSTITAHDRQRALVVPVGGQTGQARRARAAGEPLGAITTENHRALVVPEHDRENHMLIHAAHVGDVRRARRLGEPSPTVAGHGELAIVTLRRNTAAASIDEPASTLAAQGTHHGLLMYNGMPGFVRPLADSAGTVTTRNQQSLLLPYNRTAVARSVAEPSSTLTTKDREALIVSDEDIDACLFRMLQWPELLRAQVMHMLPTGDPYLLSARRRNRRGKFVELSNELRVRMIGNAVSAPVATMLGRALVESLR
jgi:DNA (cytosine-5)-methyltransferase 1